MIGYHRSITPYWLWERTPESIMFDAWVYCLKARDVEAAEFLREIWKQLQREEREAA